MILLILATHTHKQALPFADASVAICVQQCIKFVHAVATLDHIVLVYLE